MAKLKDFMISRVRVKLLKTFLSNPSEMYYVRQLVRKTDEEINAVRRELSNMKKNGMVSREDRGNRAYYSFREDYLFYSELLTLVAKTTGLGRAIIKNKNKIGTIKYAMISGRFAKGKPHDEDQVDLLVVGDIVLPELALIVKNAETDMDREINYTAMELEEFQFRKRRKDPFINRVLFSSRVMLIGDEEEMLE
jgi:DNA-binding transcriptional ArsR family regulator